MHAYIDAPQLIDRLPYRDMPAPGGSQWDSIYSGHNGATATVVLRPPAAPDSVSRSSVQCGRSCGQAESMRSDVDRRRHNLPDWRGAWRPVTREAASRSAGMCSGETRKPAMCPVFPRAVGLPGPQSVESPHALFAFLHSYTWRYLPTHTHVSSHIYRPPQTAEAEWSKRVTKLKSSETHTCLSWSVGWLG